MGTPISSDFPFCVYLYFFNSTLKDDMKNNVKELIILEIKITNRALLPYNDGILIINANTIDIIMFITMSLSKFSSDIFITLLLRS